MTIYLKPLLTDQFLKKGIISKLLLKVFLRIEYPSKVKCCSITKQENGYNSTDISLTK